MARHDTTRFLRRLTAAASLVAVSMTAAVETAQAQDSYSLRFNWKMKGEFTPFVVAEKQGYFADQGIALKLEEGSSPTLALQSVATGEDAFAYVPSVQVIQAINNGMPIKVVATVSKIDSMGMVARAGVTIASPKDLEGKKIEIAAASTFNNIWDAFARKNGLDKSKIEVVSVNPSARFGLLLSGQVDVLADIFLTNELPILAASTDKPLSNFAVGDFGFDIIGYTLVTSDDMIKNHPDAVRKVVAGAKQGFAFTAKTPKEAAQIAVAAYPELLLPGPTEGQVVEMNRFIAAGKPTELFMGSDESWQHTLDILESAGVITQKQAPSAYYTNAFIDQ